MARIEFLISRTTDGFVYNDTVMATTERGARTVAARRFNEAYRYLTATPVTATETPTITVVIERAYEANEGRAYAGTREYYFTDYAQALDTIEKWNAADIEYPGDYTYTRAADAAACYLCGDLAVVLDKTERYQWPYCAECWGQHVAETTPDVVVPAWPTADNDYSVTNGEDVTAALIQAGLDDIAETEGLSTMNCAECGAFFGHDDNGPRTVSALAAHAAHICPTTGDVTATATINEMTLTLTQHELDAEGRMQYRYSVAILDTYGRRVHYGSDLHSGVGNDRGARAMLGTLATFLSAAGESYAYAMQNSIGLDETENGTLFPEWIAEAAYIYADELDMLAHDIEEEN